MPNPFESDKQRFERESQEHLQRVLRQRGRRMGVNFVGGSSAWLENEPLPPAAISPRWTQADEDKQAAALNAAFTTPQTSSPPPSEAPKPKRSHHKRKDPK